jgi:hypothetical protein
MESVKPHDESSLRKARRMGIVFLAYVIGLPLFIIMLEPQLSSGPGPYVLSWVLILMMPVDILLLYGSYRLFGKRGRFQNIMGPAVLMYVFATAPSIYAFIIGFIDSALRFIAIPLGLMFSLMGLWLASMFISKLWESFQEFNQ